MKKIEREDILIISRFSNWSEKGIDRTLKKEIYNDKEAWEQFLKLILISLGVGFTTAGVLFFFAYNWADLHKFVKIGLIESLIIAVTLTALLVKVNLIAKNILLTGAAILVGVLFAVFGQIYQTGANAYDFFMGWTLAITLWAAVSNFAPLWLLFIALTNTTIVFYSEQVAHDWSSLFLLSLLFILNTFCLVTALVSSKVNTTLTTPNWFSNLLALASVSLSTLGIIVGLFDRQESVLVILLLLTAIAYTAGIIYGLKTKNGFYLSIVSFGIIVIISSFLIETSTDEGMFLFISLFVIGSVTLVIKTLINLQKKWNN